MNVVVIGANGFIGRELVKKLISLNYSTYAIVNKSSENIPIKCVLLNLSEAIRQNIYFDLVYLSVGNSFQTHDEYVDQSITINSLLNKLRFKKVIFLSSVAVYGEHKSIIKINSPFNEPSQYGRSKLANEFFVSRFLNYSIIRFTYVYGIGMTKNSLIPSWIKSAKEKRCLLVYGDGSRVQDYLHISDAIQLCLRVGRSNEIGSFIGASGISTSNLNLARIISSLYDKCKIHLVDVDLTPSYQYDVSETNRVLSWHHKVSIEQGIHELIRYEDTCI
jgi:UDP-glucose 4-epimerase